MCGITGIFAFNLVGKFNKIHITNATMALQKRGPDFQDIYLDDWVGLGHRRLSIIDTRDVANQPMWDGTKRYCIVFNGEIFNYRELRTALEAKGISFSTQSDTEVLLKLYIHEKEQCLSKLNGFFAFCVYDRVEQTFFVARDRYGIKPLLYVFDEDKFLFASEMKSIVQFGIDRTLDHTSLYTYLQLNYIPGPDTIFKSVKKLLPGHYIKVSRQKMEAARYYDIPYNREQAEQNKMSYADAKEKFKELLEASVKRRLVADVPLGAFLSGGIDSSVVSALASKHKPDLHTFSIGFRDEKFFDETEYARLVAKRLNTKHTVFSLTNNDLYAHVHSILDYIDEPFADSSAIAVYILSKETRKHATVALSGDGADEMFAGYNKHAAFRQITNTGWKENMVGALGPLWKALPKSRSGKFTNVVRQLSRFSEGMKLSSKDRYWQWAGYAGKDEALNMFQPELRATLGLAEFASRQQNILRHLPEKENINDILLTDMQLVLPDDMLTKVDLMSMAHGLEVRVPFLDYEVVNFAFSLPVEYKINPDLRKRIVQDAFRDVLPEELYNRPKKGFEVPLLKWFRSDMKSLITDDLLSKELILEQGIFDYSVIEKLKQQLFSANPGDVHARIWGLIVFQWWWKKYMRGYQAPE
ncbi:asparagine synthase (glutamine-hydrolyzing) [Chryseolinea lacunae]|uniref:asparagine synthase (glutamine-hydrolyzing) n=1 Tax=Chryseolinea lacunae TaxID=2801331 RepID=A0ABS1KLC8_9BACT|nr:asparagine synthase (glutamine-hydrolyzing) [Chryseolinea lacunae]MBL0740265.1 asparagine synthase (glutamine-hydrolyzing) [Chryseolinea lacunae]